MDATYIVAALIVAVIGLAALLIRATDRATSAEWRKVTAENKEKAAHIELHMERGQIKRLTDEIANLKRREVEVVNRLEKIASGTEMRGLMDFVANVVSEVAPSTPKPKKGR